MHSCIACWKQKLVVCGAYWNKRNTLKTLEASAAFFGLKIIAVNLLKCQILMRIDNWTGGTKLNPQLNKSAKEIWHWCEQRRLFNYTSYTQSTNKVVADEVSRRSHSNIELSLIDPFKIIVTKFGYQISGSNIK